MRNSRPRTTTPDAELGTPHRSWQSKAQYVVLPLLWCCFFGKFLATNQQFSFRDTAHFYYPLFQWQQDAWAEGEIPLWNPYENIGIPSLAESTSSVLYPGKMLFHLPLGYELNFKLYVTLHVLFASWSTYFLARQWRCSIAGSLLAAIAYSYGGYVFFQHCNVVFLVGAAWLPLGLLTSDRMLRRSSWQYSAAFAAVMSMMVLGGDVQAAYHLGMLALFNSILLWFSNRRLPAPNTIKPIRKLRLRSLALLGFSAALAFGLAAVQILPSMEWGQRSSRADFDTPRNIYEIFSDKNHDSSWAATQKGLLAQPDRSVHHKGIYDYSIAPWQLPELLWPNASGKLFPIGRRWTEVIPLRNRVWTMSLYMGLIPMVLATMLFRWKRLYRIGKGNARRRWLQWIAVIGLLASLGYYGIGWLIAEVAYSCFGVMPNDVPIGHPVGGLYWFFVTFLPSYVMFRFPAKWFVFFALAISILAGKNLNIVLRLPRLRKSLSVVVICLGGLNLTLALTLAFTRSHWPKWLSGIEDSHLAGPFDTHGMITDATISVLQSSLVCISLLIILRTITKTKPVSAALLLVAITMADLYHANHWMLFTSPRLPEHSEQPENAVPMRIYRAAKVRNWMPEDWQDTQSEIRHTELRNWEYAILEAKYPLLRRVATVKSSGSMTPSDYGLLTKVAANEFYTKYKKSTLPPTFVQSLGTRLILVENKDPTPPGEARQYHKFLSIQDRARAFVVRSFELRPIQDNIPLRAEVKRCREIWFPEEEMLDIHERAVIEAPEKFQPPIPSSKSSAPAIKCEVTHYSQREIRINTALENPGLLVLSDYYYPGWKATLLDETGKVLRELQILRTNRVMRGVFVPKGNHTVIYRYDPPSFYNGVKISAFCWLLVTAGFGITYFKRRKRTAQGMQNAG